MMHDVLVVAPIGLCRRTPLDDLDSRLEARILVLLA
jgi:hypothetical protein